VSQNLFSCLTRRHYRCAFDSQQCYLCRHPLGFKTHTHRERERCWQLLSRGQCYKPVANHCCSVDTMQQGLCSHCLLFLSIYSTSELFEQFKGLGIKILKLTFRLISNCPWREFWLLGATQKYAMLCHSPSNHIINTERA